jgi:hypothetical protein
MAFIGKSKPIFLVTLILCSHAVWAAAQAQSYYTDSFGNTTGPNTYLHTDKFGNTTGRLDRKNFYSYQDQFGNTTGRIGNQNFIRIQINSETRVAALAINSIIAILMDLEIQQDPLEAQDLVVLPTHLGTHRVDDWNKFGNSSAP